MACCRIGLTSGRLLSVDCVAELGYDHRTFLTLCLWPILLLELWVCCVGKLHFEDLAVDMLWLRVHDCGICPSHRCYLSIVTTRLSSSHLLLHVGTVLFICCRAVWSKLRIIAAILPACCMINVSQSTWLWGLGHFLLERAMLSSRARFANAWINALVHLLERLLLIGNEYALSVDNLVRFLATSHLIAL